MFYNSALAIIELCQKRGNSKEEHKYDYICILTYSNKISCVCLCTLYTFFEKINVWLRSNFFLNPNASTAIKNHV